MIFSNLIPFLNWFYFTLNPRLKYILKRNYDKLIIIGVVSYEILFIFRVVHDKKSQNLTVSNRFLKMTPSTNQNEDELMPANRRASYENHFEIAFELTSRINIPLNLHKCYNQIYFLYLYRPKLFYDKFLDLI